MSTTAMAEERSLPQRIKAAREILRLTQGEVAKRWGFSRRSLEAWEEGVKFPAPLYREKLERNLRRIEGQLWRVGPGAAGM
jgi:DNA-binding transcriptional regulator YiaG